MAIGVDTAMNTIVEACDRISDTASAHRRTFLVEVMGRDSGYLAMTTAIAAGADAVLIREVGKADEAIVEREFVSVIEEAQARGKRRVLVIKAEGVKFDMQKLKDAIDARLAKLHPEVDTRATVLGHVVRGGSPTAFDRLLGARLANAALRGLAEGKTDFMAGWSGPASAAPPARTTPNVILSPLEDVLRETERLMNGTSDVAVWRRRVFAEIESILAE